MTAGPNDPPDRPNRPAHRFPDDKRTTRSHAGETLEDTRNWPGIIMVALGLVCLALTLTAAGYGFEGWAIIAGILTGILLIAGVVTIVAEHRRIKSREGTRLSDQRGH